MTRLRSEPEPNPFACFSRAASSPSPSDVETPPPPQPPPPPPRPIIPSTRPPPPLYPNHHYRNPVMITTTPFMSFNPITPHHNTNKAQNIDLDLDLDLQLSVGCSTHEPTREKAYAEEARKEAKRQIQLAEEEFASAKMIRQRAQAELDRAQGLKELAMRQMSSDVVLLNLMTCTSCRQKLTAAPAADENSLVGMSYVSSSGVTDHGGEVETRR